MSELAQPINPAELSARTPEFQAFARRIIGYGIWLPLLAFTWHFEEPSKFATLLAISTVFFLGFACVRMAARRGAVTNSSQWMFVFAIKITLSLVLTAWFWVAPLAPNYLRVQQKDAVQDSVVYDYNAQRLVQFGFTHPDPGMEGLWLDLGVVRYIAVIYKIFGVSVLYVSMFNALLCLGAILCLLGTLKVCAPDKLAVWQKVRYAMLLPLGSYYDATPAKETLTNFFFYLVLLLSAMLLIGRVKSVRIKLAFVAGCALLALVRLDALMLLGAVVCTAVFIAQAGWTKRVLIAASLAVMVIVFVLVVHWIIWPTIDPATAFDDIIDLQGRIELAQQALAAKQSFSNPLVAYVGGIVVPRSVPDFFLYAPLRTIIWTYLPFPLVFPHWAQLSALPSLLGGDFRTYISSTSDLCAKASSLVMILLTPAVFAVFRDRKCRQNRGVYFLLAGFLVSAIIISNLQVFETRRYRVLLEPLFVALALWGSAYGRPERYARWIWPLFLVPAMLVWALNGVIQ